MEGMGAAGGAALLAGGAGSCGLRSTTGAGPAHFARPLALARLVPFADFPHPRIVQEGWAACPGRLPAGCFFCPAARAANLHEQDGLRRLLPARSRALPFGDMDFPRRNTTGLNGAPWDRGATGRATEKTDLFFFGHTGWGGVLVSRLFFFSYYDDFPRCQSFSSSLTSHLSPPPSTTLPSLSIPLLPPPTTTPTYTLL